MARYRAGIETRGRILAATRGLLGDAGLEGTTLKAICDRAEVGAGSFYNLFDSKEEAVLAVVRDAIAQVDPGGASANETVTDLVDAYLEFVTGTPDLARIYLQAAVSWGFADPEVAARFRRHHARRVERLNAALQREGVGGEEAAARAELAVSTLNGLTVNWLLDPSVDVEHLRERLLRIVRPAHA